MTENIRPTTYLNTILFSIPYALIQFCQKFMYALSIDEWKWYVNNFVKI